MIKALRGVLLSTESVDDEYEFKLYENGTRILVAGPGDCQDFIPLEDRLVNQVNQTQFRELCRQWLVRHLEEQQKQLVCGEKWAISSHFTCQRAPHGDTWHRWGDDNQEIVWRTA